MSESASDQNITTFLRIKPSKNPSNYFNVDELQSNRLIVNLPETFKSEYVDNTRLHHGFAFNGVLNMKCSQDDVFKQIGIPSIKNAFEGFNSSIFVYGQTGSGKTFTLTGGAERYADRGIIPRAISMIYSEARNRTDAQFKISISYFEIYNEQGHDLLASDDSRPLEELPKIKVLEDEKGGFHLKNLSIHSADTEEDALNLLFLGDTNRAVAETPMNLASSRSHCIFLLSIEARDHGSDKIRRSKLNLIDLAGSERIGKTNSTGSVLREAKYINSSLFYLEVVITALHERATIGRAHIPYRNSLMTSVLRDSLGGNCKTTMIATISADAAHTEESLSTCRFAQRVSQIKNKVSVNEEIDPALMIRRLKSEVLTLREEIAFLKGENNDDDDDDDDINMSSLMMEELRKKIREYCDDRDMTNPLNIGKLTLGRMKQSFVIFKSLVLQAEAALSSSSSSSSSSTKQQQQKSLSNTSTSSDDNDDDTPVIRGRSNNNNNNKSKPISTTSHNNHSHNQLEINNNNNNNNIKIISDLQESLLQREHEIAILVNMVKQGKTVDDVTSGASGTAAGTSDTRSTRNDDSKEEYDDRRYNTSTDSRRMSNSHNNNNDTSSIHNNNNNNNSTNTTNTTESSYESRQRDRQRLFELDEKRRKERDLEKQDRILKTRLFNVPPPPTLAIFEDSGASFEWFESRCSVKKSMDENMEMLREAIRDAKAAGERANKSRNTINYLKSSIEAIRRERALETVSSVRRSQRVGGNQEEEGKGAEVNDKEEEEVEDVETEEEVSLRRSIDREKSIYKDSFELLRELKPRIEHIKRVVEKCRNTMMQQYDQWYSYLHSKPFNEIMTQPVTLEQSVQQSQPWASPRTENSISIQSHSSSLTSAETFSKSSASSVFSSPPRASSNNKNHHHNSNSSNNMQSAASGNGYMNAGSSSSRDKRSGSISARSGTNNNNGNTRMSGNSGTSHNNIPSSSSSSSSNRSEVDDDIEAFYRAKEQLVKMQQQQQEHKS